MKNAAVMLALSCAGWVGCVTAPYPAPDPFAADEMSPSDVPARFEARLAPRFEQVNALVFSFMTRDLAALGVASVDRPTRSFSATCMTPLGVKLFDVVCSGGRVEARFVHPELAKRGGDLAQAAGADLTHAYFDWQPPERTPYAVRNGRLVFAATDATGVTEYRYAWRDGRLAEKIRFEKGRRLWSVEYRAYACGADGLIPTGLVIANRKYGYRLVVSTREEKR